MLASKQKLSAQVQQHEQSNEINAINMVVGNNPMLNSIGDDLDGFMKAMKDEGCPMLDDPAAVAAAADQTCFLGDTLLESDLNLDVPDMDIDYDLRSLKLLTTAATRPIV